MLLRLPRRSPPEQSVAVALSVLWSLVPALPAGSAGVSSPRAAPCLSRCPSPHSGQKPDPRAAPTPAVQPTLPPEALVWGAGSRGRPSDRSQWPSFAERHREQRFSHLFQMN